MGSRMPVETARSAFDTVTRVAKEKLRALGRSATRSAKFEPADIELLCDLHYQNTRLGVEYQKPFRFMQSALQAYELSARLGRESRARARSLSRCTASFRPRCYAATRVRRRSTQARPSRGSSVIRSRAPSARVCAGWVHHLRATSIVRSELICESASPTMHLGSRSASSATPSLAQSFLESMRGRHREASGLEHSRPRRALCEGTARWMQPSVRMCSPAHAPASRVSGEKQSEPWVQALLVGEPPRSRGFYHLISWGPRARYLLETDQLEQPLAALCKEFAAEGIVAKSSHPIVCEYYVAIAYARLARRLRASATGGGGANPRRAQGRRRGTESPRQSSPSFALTLSSLTRTWRGSRATSERLARRSRPRPRSPSRTRRLGILSEVALGARAHLLVKEQKLDAAREQEKRTWRRSSRRRTGRGLAPSASAASSGSARARPKSRRAARRPRASAPAARVDAAIREAARRGAEHRGARLRPPPTSSFAISTPGARSSFTSCRARASARFASRGSAATACLTMPSATRRSSARSRWAAIGSPRAIRCRPASTPRAS